MLARTVRPSAPNALWLLPPSPHEWLPENHLTYFLSDLVETLTLPPSSRPLICASQRVGTMSTT
ncbi:MAG: hypothetical protein OEV77_00950 [Nitrospira sp.]|nr:hypothetical protein [Nitrospira sp.]